MATINQPIMLLLTVIQISNKILKFELNMVVYLCLLHVCTKLQVDTSFLFWILFNNLIPSICSIWRRSWNHSTNIFICIFYCMVYTVCFEQKTYTEMKCCHGVKVNHNYRGKLGNGEHLSLEAYKYKEYNIYVLIIMQHKRTYKVLPRNTFLST